MGIELSGYICPLTPLENRLRQLGGEAGYAGGFVEHYLLPVIYPLGLTREWQIALGLGVAQAMIGRIVLQLMVAGLLLIGWIAMFQDRLLYFPDQTEEQEG